MPKLKKKVVQMEIMAPSTFYPSAPRIFKPKVSARADRTKVDMSKERGNLADEAWDEFEETHSPQMNRDLTMPAKKRKLMSKAI